MKTPAEAIIDWKSSPEALSRETNIHFNANLASNGYYVPLVQLPIIRRHLEKLGLL